MTKRFIPALCWAIGLLLQGMSTSVWAAPEPETQPRYYTNLSFQNGQNLYFDSPQSAWDYYKPIGKHSSSKITGPNGHPDILQDV
jgi:hypothetical protein